jgi:hypothetical protein
MRQRASTRLFISGMALLALAGVIAGATSTGAFGVALAVAAAGLLALALGWRQQRRERYDLNLLWEAPPPDPDEPTHDVIPDDEDGAPYCGWCDEAYPPGVRRCRSCGREL